MDSNNSNVPYQTYRSKKHLRSQSSTPNASAAVTPDLHPNSYFAHTAPPPVPDSVLPQRLEPSTQPNLSEMHVNTTTVSSRNSSVSDVQSRDIPPVVVVVSAAAQDKSAEPTASVIPSSTEPEAPRSNGKLKTPESPSVDLPGERDSSNQSDVSTATAVPTSNTFTPPTSTFRRISSRTRSTSEHSSPSAARPSPTVANSPSFRRVANSSRLRFNSESSVVSESSHAGLSGNNVTSANNTTKLLQPAPVHVPHSSPNLLSTNPPLHHAGIPNPPISHSNHPSRPSSVSASSSPASSRRSTSTLPYRPGFQPKGIYRQRTDDFIELRSSIRDKGKVETRRLERRLEKLIQLHFPQETMQEKVPSSPSNRRSKSLLDIDLKRNPSEIWRDVVETRMQSSKTSIRAEEQHITPWQPDAEVSQCPHCSASFHPLTNRKHHCRLCGRVVCSLPLKHPVRKQLCSILFIVDQQTSMIEEVGEGVDYGVKRRTPSNAGEPSKEKDDEKFLKGVRICKSCRTVLRRQQYLQETARIPTFVRLHDTLVNLEKEIEDVLKKFQESMLTLPSSDSSLSHNTPSQLDSTAHERKRLLELFSSYDRISKRIAQLPTPKGGSQERVQNAVLSRATLFLQTNMLPLQSLNKFQPSPGPSPNPSKLALEEEDKRLAEDLQPLLEQETLLEGFIEEAKAQRKFEDARTLKANLEEIRAEIKRMALQAGASVDSYDDDRRFR